MGDEQAGSEELDDVSGRDVAEELPRSEETAVPGPAGKRTITRHVQRETTSEVVDEVIEEDIIWAPPASNHPYPVG